MDPRTSTLQLRIDIDNDIVLNKRISNHTGDWRYAHAEQRGSDSTQRDPPTS
jgi:hypothetical protein